MIGAIVGDVIGSTREFAPIKTKEFPLFDEGSIYTDDTILTVAIGTAFVDGAPLVDRMKEFVQEYVTSYGHGFWTWANSPSDAPYGSWGNGASMRVSSAAWLARNITEAFTMAGQSAAVTHDHPEGIRGAQATALAIYLARAGWSADAIRSAVANQSGYDLSRRVDDIRPTCVFELKSWICVPEAIICALEATSFEDAIRNAVSLGGDADTQAAIAGAIAEPLFGGVPPSIAEEALRRIPPGVKVDLMRVLAAAAPTVAPDRALQMLPKFDPASVDVFDLAHDEPLRYARDELAKWEKAEKAIQDSWTPKKHGGLFGVVADWFRG